ncbi:MAG: glycosyltransferase family 2 protein [Caldilineaceae bacterium]
MHIPKFSVVIPTYNRAHFLPRAISSVLNQTFTDFELIIADDGSTDNTQEIINSIMDPKVKYIYQENAGGGAARNLGASIAKGEYLTFLDSDDEAMPQWLEHYFRVFESTNADVICCGFERVAEAGHTIKEKIVLPKNMGPIFDDQVGMFTHGGTFALRRQIFEALGGYAADLTAGQHTELAMRLIPLCRDQRWNIHNLDLPLIKYYLHSGPSIRKNYRAKYQGIKYVLEHHEAKLQRVPQIYAIYLANAGVNAARLGDFVEARNLIFSAIRFQPWDWKNYGRMILTMVPSLGAAVWQRMET